MEYNEKILKRIQWIKDVLQETGAKGIVYGNSGGKDSALVGILSKIATDNVTGIVMPCESKRNYNIDREHAYLVADKYKIKTIEIDLTSVKGEFKKVLEPHIEDNVPMAYNNINPRLRMISLYAYAQSYNYLVAGTGNLSELTMGYFTKWGDGGCDFNPIADLTVSDVYELLDYFDCPKEITNKKPSAGLYDGQTDEEEMGITYDEIDKYIKTGESKQANLIKSRNKATKHKRTMPKTYKEA